MTWTLVIAAAAFAAGWYFGRLERTGCEAWAQAQFEDLGACQADLRDERDRADVLAGELARHVAALQVIAATEIRASAGLRRLAEEALAGAHLTPLPPRPRGLD